MSQIWLIILCTLLFVLVVYLSYLLFKSRQETKQLRQELNNQTLDYHLKRVKELGYEFTIKAGSSIKVSERQHQKKSSKSKTFSDLIEK